MPGSVDLAIVAASLVMPADARASCPVSRVVRVMLGLGVLAAVAANAAYGWRSGLVGMAVSAWPTVALIGSVEVSLGGFGLWRDVARAVGWRGSTARLCECCACS
jgi:hypothetical protein